MNREIISYAELSHVFVEASYLFILKENELVQLDNFVLCLDLLLLVLMEHDHQGVETFVARVAQVLDNFLSHLDFHFVVFQLLSQLLGILNQPS